MKLDRRKNALARLEAQLKSGVKPAKETGRPTITDKTTPLTEGDRKRIKREIQILDGIINPKL